MNALVRKEVRSILPAGFAAMVLAILPVWIVWPGPGGGMFGSLGMLVFGPFALGVLLLSITPIGQELSYGTFSVLLAQPVSRRRLWLVKTLVLGVALGAVYAAWCLSNHFRVDSAIETLKQTVWRNAFNRPGEDNRYFVKWIAETRQNAAHDTFIGGWLAVLAGFGGGLWTTLLFRQVTAAFWLTCLVPIGLSLLTSRALGGFSGTVAEAGLFVVLVAYSAGGFFWAKRMFLRVQDTHWTGGVIALPQWRSGRAAGAERVSQRNRKPVRALLGKEFQAHQINLLLAAGLLALHLVVVLLRKLGADYLATHQSVAMTVEEFPRVWLVMPLLIGSVAVAEERKFGTLESSLCLPAKRRVQFLVKLMVAMVLGVVCGGVLPLVVEKLAGIAGLRENPSGLYFLGETRSIFLVQLAGSAGLTGLALYGSTLSRNSLQAMGVGLLASAGACFAIFGAGLAGGSEEFYLWRGPLVGLIGWPLMCSAIVILAYRNFCQLQPNERIWRRNGLTLLISLTCVGVATTVIYHRAWEAWLPEEPHHGWDPALYARTQWQGREIAKVPGQPIKLQACSFRTAAVLPGGQLWLSQRKQRPPREVRIGSYGMVRGYAPGRLHSGFVEGSNWRDAAVTYNGSFGIQTDGSLWDFSELEGSGAGPKRVGENRGWVSISAAGEHYSALKSDGTLWQWGQKTFQSRDSVSIQENQAPAQVGRDMDWGMICDSWMGSAAVKTDGSIWRWNWDFKEHRQPERWLTGPSNRPVSLALADRAVAAVCEDGTLWIGGELTNTVYDRLIQGGEIGLAKREMVRWGNDSDWKEIHFTGWGKAIAIKRDGTLWQWTLAWFGPMKGWIIPPTMPSRYMDWVAACGDENSFLALARDGSLCRWGDPGEGRYQDWDGPDPSRLLMPSRIKARKVADFSR